MIFLETIFENFFYFNKEGSEAWSFFGRKILEHMVGSRDIGIGTFPDTETEATEILGAEFVDDIFDTIVTRSSG